MANATITLVCDSCNRKVRSYGFVHVTAGSGTRKLCNRCFNDEAARLLGVEDEYRYAEVEPVVLRDARGGAHEFHFRSHLYGEGLLLEAAELTDGVPRGYKFAVSGLPSDDPGDLLDQLLAKARLGLSQTHIVEHGLGPGIGREDLVRGRIEWDDESGGRIPVLIVDGRPISWEQFGVMLMAY